MKPIVSIIVPCYNEEKYIGKCIQSAFGQTLGADKIELLIVDGMSTDSTRQIVREYSGNRNLKLLDNHRKITPAALNIGIKESSGEYICIWGAHSEYDEKFLENSILMFNEHPEISCTGGPIISRGEGEFGIAAAAAMSSSIGVGNAKHRFPEYEGYAEMACFPVFKREVFNEIGLYDEELIRNQDDEYCFRLRLNGGKIFISPQIQSVYYTRNTPGSLFKQYFNYGYWRMAVLKKHKIPISFRQQVPAVFFLLCLVLLIYGIISENYIVAAALPGFYLSILIIFAIYKSFTLGIRVSLLIPFAVVILHISYAAGFIKGFFRFILKKSK